MWYQQKFKNPPKNSKCCCPLAFNQTVVYIIAILMVICGIAGLVCRFTIFNYEQKIFILDQKTEQFYDIFKLVLMIASICLIVLGIVGIIGAKTKSKCILFFYSIGTIILILLFLATGTIGLFIYKQYSVFSYPNIKNLSSCTTNANLISEADFSYYTFQTFCSNNCPCNMTDENFKKLNPEQQFYASNRSIHGYNKLQDCPYFMNNYQQNQTTLLNALILMEQTLSCTGICYDLGYHVFTDINSGNVGSIINCNQAGWNVLEDVGPKIMILGYFASALLVINLLLTFCICCHPHFGTNQKKQDVSNYYQQI